MKITQEEVVDRQTVLEIELEDEDMAPYLDRAYRRVVQQTNVPGFRKGKAPRSIIEGILGRERLVAESLDDVLPAVTHQAIVEQELDAAGTPQVELVALEPVTVKATVPLTPAVELGGYLDIRVEDEQVEIRGRGPGRRGRGASGRMRGGVGARRAIGPIGRSHHHGSPRPRWRGVHHRHGRHRVHGRRGGRSPLCLASPLEVVGAEVDSPFAEFQLTIPDEHFNASLAGKEAHFRITVKEIKERSLPDLDDEFAKGIGGRLRHPGRPPRESVRSRMVTEAEQARDTKLREDALVTGWWKGAEFDIPPLLIDREVQHMTDTT